MNDRLAETTEMERIDEELVAYLDGELDAQSGRQLEERVARDAALQQRLKSLQRSWDMLDDLPRSQVDEGFTQTTVEMVALAAAEDVGREQLAAPRRRRRRWLAVVVAMFIAGAGGYAGVAALRPDPNDALLRDLPVIENFEQYRHIDDIDFLRKLHEKELFAEEESDV